MPNQPNHAQPTQPCPTIPQPTEHSQPSGHKRQRYSQVARWSPGVWKPRFFCWDEVWKNHPIFNKKTRKLHMQCGVRMFHWYLHIYICIYRFMYIYVYTYICLCKFDHLCYEHGSFAHNIWTQERYMMCFPTILSFFQSPSNCVCVCVFRSFWSRKLGYSIAYSVTAPHESPKKNGKQKPLVLVASLRPICDIVVYVLDTSIAVLLQLCIKHQQCLGAGIGCPSFQSLTEDRSFDGALVYAESFLKWPTISTYRIQTKLSRCLWWQDPA